ncbi:asparagine--tRNA ligase [Hamiltosporidium magnivora]|uniref:asparagine--tRNA ligase n=1 Tax=Hamiltosporidium magnivora TaxID=148818 RepID=A0A4Q9L172_9MICR|nr:asparagine--tRNA ligase [Hamiltosporidium magnivora]
MTERIESQIIDLSIQEESIAYKKVQLTDLSKDFIGQKICTFGWVITCRTTKAGMFIDLYCGFKTIKCLYPREFEHKYISKWTSLTIYGEVKENYKHSKDSSEFEVHIDRMEIFGGKQSPPFPINNETLPFVKLEKGHLNLRTEERIFFLKARSCLMRHFRDFYYKNNYIEITPPTIVKTQVEGGSTLFNLKYYGSDAYLTQSSQLYLETVVPVTQKAYCIMPSYRAEKSNTTRHLSEYTHVEAELADLNFSDLLDSIEKLVSYVISKFYEEMRKDILILNPNFEFLKVVEKPFKRIRYTDAIEFLRNMKYLKEDGTEFVCGDDIPDAGERFLVEKYGEGLPVFLTHFPVSFKPFYMRKEDEDNTFTESCDLLFPGIGEILGGSMRCEKHSELIEGFKREKIDTENYFWYTDLLLYGPFRHGGYGLGFERLLMGLMRWESVNKACLYPRFLTRCAP